MQPNAIIKESYVLNRASRTGAASVSSQKAKRLRISWFLLGTVAGIALTLSAGKVAAHLSGKDVLAALTSHAAQDVDLAVMPGIAETVEEPAPREFTLTVRKGDTLIDLITAKGVSYNEAHSLIEALRPHYNPRRIVVGQSLQLALNGEPKTEEASTQFEVASIRVKTGATTTLELAQSAKGQFTAATHEAPVATVTAFGGGTITSSLYQTGAASGVPSSVLGALINAYSYDVDFQRDIRRGDSFNVVYEQLRHEEDGSVIGSGNVLYASLVVDGVEKRIYRYTTTDGDADFYDEKGHSVRKALLRTPVNGARLSSGFGPRRHPILGYNKMHKGIDFAAPSGTPIYAAGDGKVEYAGRKGSYGNYVRIRHNNQYSTAYAHMSRIAAKNGSRVKQGDVIGYVGTTGASTGPHLHYEVLAGNNHINPRDAKFENGRKLQGRELAAFKDTIKQVDLLVARLVRGETTVAALR